MLLPDRAQEAIIPDVVIVLPVGPAERVEDIRDTVESIDAYAEKDRRLIIVDDSGTGTAKRAGVDAEIIETPGRSGVSGGLYLALSQGFLQACDRPFGMLLKMDVDALFIAPGLERAAMRAFDADPKLGMLGSYRVDCEGVPREHRGVGKTLMRDARSLRPHGRMVREWMVRALLGGYRPGWHCLGGAYCLSEAFVRDAQRRGWLGVAEVRTARSCEDHLFSLIAFATGRKLGDLTTGSLPMGLRHIGLPASPADLVRRGKSIIHSVKNDADRAYLASLRRGSA